MRQCAGTPAGEIGVCCARIGAAGSFELMPNLLAGMILGSGWFMADMFLMTALAFGRRVPGLPSAVLASFKRVNALPVLSMCFAAGVFLWLVPRFMRWSFDRRAVRLTRERRRWLRRFRRWAAPGLVVTAIVVSVGAGLGLSWFVAAMSAAQFASLGGALLACVGVRVRRGKRLVCGMCDYPLNSWRAAPERCPECGNLWKQPWRIRIGRRCVRWDWIGLGSLLMIVSAGIAAAVGTWGFNVR